MLEGLLVDLVPFGEAYVDLLHKWENSEASFWSDVGDHRILTRDQIKASLEEEENDPSRRSSLTFGVQTKDGTPIGFFSANWILPHHRLALLGYVIGEPAYWGHGYGTDALLLLVDYLFDWLDIRKVFLETMSLNARMVRHMEKVGFVLEVRRPAAIYAANDYHDTLIYSVWCEEWPGREAIIERIGLKAR